MFNFLRRKNQQPEPEAIKTVSTIYPKLEPIDDLSVGDCLKMVKKNNLRWPKVGDIVYVHSVFPEIVEKKETARTIIKRADFSAILIDDDGDHIEGVLDSRFFERISQE